MTGVSVVTCCYNSRNRILPTLQTLSAQIVAGFDWEIVVVDNNSSDDTAGFITDSWRSIGSPVSLSIITEPTPGLRHARECGIRAARFDFILFCDDDNRLSPGYVQKVYNIFQSDPAVGVIGGLGVAVSAGPLPEWFSKFQNLFAVGPPVAQPGQLPLGMGYVYGAGMALRKQAWLDLESYGFRGLSVDRRGSEVTGGHDVEVGHAIRLIGYKAIFEDSLVFDHYMERERLTWPYVISLIRGSSSNVVPFVYFALLHRGVSSSMSFLYSYLKRVASDGIQIIRLRLSLSKDRDERAVLLAMTKTSFTFFLRNFQKAFGYFRQIRRIKLIREENQ